MASNYVQYIIVRSDLLSIKGFSIGALITQGAHASVAALKRYEDNQDTIFYLSNLERMHKITLASHSQESLINLAKVLTVSNIDHYLWYEQPENIPTAIATRPYIREFIKPYFSDYKLFK